MKAVEVFPAEMPEIDAIYAFISRILPQNGVDAEVVNLFMMASDEIFSNIVNHGVKESKHEVSAEISVQVEISVQIEEDAVSMTFRDNGKLFDPLSLKSPDTSLGLKERPIGGLGIYIVKNSFDETSYSYENGFNVFTVKKWKN